MMKSKKIKHTISVLTDEIIDYKNPDLFLGAGALANSLFYYKLSKYLNDDLYIDLAINEFEKVYNIIENVDVNSNMNLVSGYSGVAWLFQYYVNNDVLEYDADFFSFFDKIIIDQCKKDKLLGRYDLFYGILGYGSYFLQRNRFDKINTDKYLNEIVQVLSDISIEDSDGIYWFSDMFSNEKNKINIGMAHGLPSIISLLTKIYSINKNSLAKDMLIKATNWLLKFKKNDKNSSSMFPYFIDRINKKISTSSTTRLAWCYGDLTIGYVVFVLGKTIKNIYFINQGLDILKNCASKKIDDPATGVHDKGFCHGTSGIYYIFHKLNIDFKSDEFKHAEEYWLEKTVINLDENIESLKSYATLDNKIHFAHDYGLINGYPGIGLTLLSSLNTDGNEWDEIFML